MRCLKTVLPALICLLSFIPLYSQDSLAFKLQQDNLSTNNDLNVDQTFQIGPTTLVIHDILRYKVYSHESSQGGEDQYSLEHLLKSDLFLFGGKNSSIRLESNQYQDHRTGLRSSITNWALLGGYRFSENLFMYLGGRSVNRFGIEDKGWTTSLLARKRWLSDTQALSFQMVGDRDELEDHQNYHVQAQGEYLVRFGGISSYRTSIRMEDRQQEFFTDSLRSSQERSNQNLVWNNHFAYNLNRQVRLTHDLNWGDQSTEISRERIDRNSISTHTAEDRTRLVLSNETGLHLEGDRLSSVSAFKIENSQNKYYVDYSQVLYQLREDVIFHPSSFIDSLTWRNTLSRLEYDTPDTNNDDDRDEWRYKTEISAVYQPNPFMRLEVGTKLSLFHLIYLFNTRSAENYWNRNLVLWSEFDWRRNAWDGRAKTHIRTNYFDYDYDDLFIEMDQPSRSFVHRSLDLSKQIRYRFLTRWSLTTKIASRWEDEGQLDWTQFIQQVSSERQQTEASVKLAFAYRGWIGWIGYLNHSRITTYAGTNRENVQWNGEGPLFGVRHLLGDHLFLDLDGRVISVVDGDRDYILPKIFLSLVYR